MRAGAHQLRLHARARARAHAHERARERESRERERESQAECFKTPFHSQLFSRLRLELWLQLYGSALLSGIVWVLCRLSVPTEVRPIVPHRLSSHMQQLRVPAPAANRAHQSCLPNDYPQARMGQTKNVQLLPAPPWRAPCEHPCWCLLQPGPLPNPGEILQRLEEQSWEGPGSVHWSRQLMLKQVLVLWLGWRQQKKRGGQGRRW